MDSSFQSTSLVAALAAALYLYSQCMKPPNPNPKESNVKDRIALVTDDMKSIRYMLILIWLYHSLLILYPDDRLRFCPHPELLNQDLFSWSKTTITCISIMFIAGPIRLLSYSGLGKNFTFRLMKPKTLIKDGLYAYVQHPSYTTLFLAIVASAFFWMRLDGIAACLLPSFFVKVKGLADFTAVAVSMCAVLGLWVRVKDEEAMLKREFGEEWVEYHKKTKRFIPGIF